jgi:hypothetical protein
VVVDFLVKENSKVEIVNHVYTIRKLGYAAQLGISIQLEVDLQQEGLGYFHQIGVSPQAEVDLHEEVENHK